MARGRPARRSDRRMSTRPAPRLGLADNWRQFSLLVVVNAFVGRDGRHGAEHPAAIGGAEFHLPPAPAILSFIVVFGVAKALTNYLAGRLSRPLGRKPVLVAGWLVALPVPFMLMWAPSVGLGDLRQRAARHQPGPHLVDHRDHEDRPRGPRAAGARDGAERVRRLRGGRLGGARHRLIAARFGLRPEPFFSASSSWSSASPSRSCRARDARPRRRSRARGSRGGARRRRSGRCSCGRLSRPRPVGGQPGRPCEQPQRRDGLGPLPAVLRRRGDDLLEQIGWLAASIRRCGASGQLFTGPLSDRVGRKWLIAAGMWVQAARHCAGPRCPPASPASQSAPSCSGSARRWSIRRCSPRSATSRTRLAGDRGRRVPVLARPRLRRRRAARRPRRRSPRPRGRHRRGGRRDVRLRPAGCRSHARDPRDPAAVVDACCPCSAGR